MQARHVTPIINVSDIQRSVAWFESLGWSKLWDWGTPPTFGAVKSGDVELFMCLDGQGHRQDPGAPYVETAAVWMSIWVDDVDVIHKDCMEKGIEVTWPPTDEPWGVREMHIRHPDGHIFRISCTVEVENPKGCDDEQ